jgi:hypothetical protein
MFVQKRFRFKTATLAITSVDGMQARPSIVNLPAEAIIEAPAEVDTTQPEVEVLWEGRAVKVFTIDLRERGEEIDADGVSICSKGVH